MKKIIIAIFMAFSCFSSNAQCFPVNQIVNASFSSSTTVCANDSEFVDFIKIGGCASWSSLLDIYIQTSSGTNAQKIYSTHWDSVWYYGKINSDSSRRVYFKMPATYVSGPCNISIDFQTQANINTTFCSNADIESFSNNNKKEIIGMYNSEGIQVTEKIGFVILLYSDGTREKVIYFE